MSTRVELPNDNYCLFKDADELSNKDVKRLRRAAQRFGVAAQRLRDLGLDEIQAEPDPETPPAPPTAEDNQKALTILAQLTDDEDDDLDLFQRTCVVVRFIEWSLDVPRPTAAEDVDNLPRQVYGILTTEAAKLDLTDDFSMDAGAVDPKVDTDKSDDCEPPSPEEPS